MPISVVCECGAKLNAPDTAAGKRVKCPKCGTALTVPAPEADFEIVDDEDERPVKSRSRREDDEEDEDDRPARRRSRRDDDDEEEDEEERPRPKKKKKGRKAAPKSNLPLILGIGGGVLVLAVIGVVLAIVFSGGGGKAVSGPVVPQGGGPGPMMNNPGGRGGPMGNQPDAEWEPFDQPEFSISIPKGGSQIQRDNQAEGRFGEQFQNVRMWVKSGPTGVAYVIGVLPLSGEIKAQFDQNRSEAIRLFGENMTSRFPAGNVESNTEMMVSGKPGRQAIVRTGPGKTIIRVYFGNSHLIMLTVAGPFQTVDDPVAKPFLDGFQPK